MYLIDTHILIWYLTGSPKLVPENLKIIEDDNHERSSSLKFFKSSSTSSQS